MFFAAWLAISAHARPFALGDRPVGPQALVVASSVLKDSGGELTIKTVRQLDARYAFRPLERPFGAGYVRDVYWLKLHFERGPQAPADWWLQLGPASLDDVRMTHVPPSGQAQPEQSIGINAAGTQRIHRAATFALHLEPGAHVLYLRVKSFSSLSLLPRLIPADLAMELWEREYLLLGTFTGAEVVLVAAALIGALSMRRRVYTFLALFVTLGALQRFALSGLLDQWLFVNAPLAADQLSSALVGLTGAAGILFFAELFDCRIQHRWIYRVMVASAAYIAAIGMTRIIGGPGHLAAGAGMLLLLNCLLMALPLRRSWQAGNAQVRFGVAGFVVYAGLLLLHVMALLGWLPPWPALLEGAHAASLLLLSMMLLTLFIQATHAARAQRDKQLAERSASEAMAAHERERLIREDQAHLLSMLAHEFRTPVAVVDAAVQSLRLLDEHATPERIQRHERIARAVVRMNTLMELTLTRDRLEVSRWEQAPSPVNLAALTREVVDMAGAAAEERVRIDAVADLVEVQADERMLRFALLNLVDNALKYSPQGSPVDVMIAPSQRDGHAGCTWTISDQGRGLSAVDSERVFARYFRVGEASDAPGIGLGLYIVKQIVERHHGRVVAVPTPPHCSGARFECWLPRDPGVFA